MHNNNKSVNTVRLAWGMLAVMVLALVVSPALKAAENPLVVGIFPRRNATQTMRLFQPLVAHLEAQLQRQVRLVTAKDFPSFWQGVENGSFDLVHYNQYHYIKSSAEYQVIAHNKEFGRSTVAGALYVRKDSGITAIEQLRGHQVVFGGGEDAMMSYILPRYLLQQAGLGPDDYRWRFASNPPNVLLALYYQQTDASGGGDILKDIPLVKQQIDTEQLVHLATTEQLLHLPWAVKRSMPESLKQLIQQQLVSLEQSEAGRDILRQAKMSGIGAAVDQDYARHREIIAAVQAGRE
ncbi:PhnD/SsuA/transferrin family substrate-binding protein [Motiliproteus sediminis]|uniref:PhnD/SsuA/transferrin family substrate-binding protein n=1 Tax=Motiliproteus sediminis TaxID=1468178 RepID=UPI001AEF4F5D|nr:PhnD/SsuA/transferrin family substrate-binding protein [Motiliproteus sediminis]